MESKDAYDSRKKVAEGEKEAKEENYALERAYPKPFELHVPQTLDRSYHLGLKSTETRDDDQVVLLYTTEQREAWKKETRQQGFPQDKAQDGGTASLKVGSKKPKKPEGNNDQDNGQSDTKELSPGYNTDSTQLQEGTSHTQQTEVLDPMQDGTSPAIAQALTTNRKPASGGRKSHYDPKDVARLTAEKVPEQTAVNKGPVVALLMVHQLWLWKIDERKVQRRLQNQ